MCCNKPSNQVTVLELTEEKLCGIAQCQQQNYRSNTTPSEHMRMQGSLGSIPARQDVPADAAKAIDTNIDGHGNSVV